MKRSVFFCLLFVPGFLLYGQDWDPEARYVDEIQEMREMSAYLDAWDASFEAAETLYDALERRYGADEQKREDLQYYKHVLTSIGDLRSQTYFQPEWTIRVRNEELAKGISLTDERSKTFVVTGRYYFAVNAFQAMLPVFERAVKEMNALLAGS
jgi:hypothetical protein